jgi:hypothetical protein
MSKMNSLQLVGLILILSALGGNFLFPGTIVTYSTGTAGAVYWPGMTTPNSPYYVKPNSTVYPTITLENLSPSDIRGISVQISAWTGSAWNPVETINLAQVVNTIFQTSFQVGNSGTLYALSYAFGTVSSGSFTDLEYIKTASLSGYFSINGQEVDTTSTLTVSNPALSLTYTLTGGQVLQSQVTTYVQLLNGTSQLQQVTLTPSTTNSALFTGSITLPAPGTYQLNGYVTYAGSTTLQMSILAPWGTGLGISRYVDLSTAYWTMGIVGVVFVALGSRKQKKKAKSE